MVAQLLMNKNLVIPLRAESDGNVGDGMIVISPDDPDYKKWLSFSIPATAETERQFGNISPRYDNDQ